MAPINGPVKPRRSASGKQSSKPVVPAIPLPHLKRQAAAAAAVAPTKATNAKDTVNGNRGSQLNRTERVTPILDDNTPQVAESPLIKDPGTSRATREAETDSHNIDVITAVEATPAPSIPTVASSQVAVKKTRVTAAKAAASTNTQAFPRLTASESAIDMPSKLHGAVATAATEFDSQPNAGQYPPVKPASSQPPPPVSPSRYQMPPQFQPANRPLGVIANGDISRGHRGPLPNAAHHMHQAHPSNSSVHFGAFHDSQSSSPAPLHSGGLAPPPGMPVPDGRPPHMMGMNGTGYPPSMPYSAEMMPAANYDNYGHPAMAYGPMDSYPQYGNTLGPSTPHSFHDSQSSAPEEATMYNQYPPVAPRNGVVGPGDDSQSHNHQGRMFAPPDYSRMGPNPSLPPQIMPQGDNADGLIGYLQQQFAAPELADCVLELRYADDRMPPVRIPGHRFVFARSFHLFNLLQKQTFEASPSDRALQTLLLETDSKWIRSGSFYMAVQRLYGLPLLQAPLRRNGLDSGDVTDAGSAGEQLDFALAYAAAGHLLDWAPVVRRGCEEVAHLLSWETLEKVLQFALDDYDDKGTHDVYKYGEGSRVLLGAIVTFIVHNLPSHFILDEDATDAMDAAQYNRLPIGLPPVASEGPSVDKDIPQAPVDESSVQLGKGRRTQKLSGIQFGDLSFAEGLKNGAATETPKATRQAQPASHSVLSRILLDIPFPQLKMILESSGSGNVNGWANAESRYRIIKAAVEGRESRRRRVLEAVLSGRIPDSEAIRGGLGSPEPRDLGRWSVLGWQEDMLPYGNSDGPTLARKWVPLIEPHNGPVAAYP